MVNLKKVVKIGSEKTTNPNKKDQEKYEEKVKKMQAACKKFEEKFKEYLDIPKMWQGLLKCYFEEQMAKNRLVSRTSRILHDMSKKLSKFKGKFDPKKVAEYSMAFNFKAKTANSKDYIKRSAIDDANVVNFFTNYIPDLLKKANPFDEKTKTFTVKTENDFRKVEKYYSNIKKIIIGENIKTVEDEAFSGCTALQSIDLGRVTNIGESAFSGCTALQSIDLGCVTNIGKSSFSRCTALQSIDLGCVTNIEGFAFSGCTKLQNIDLKNVKTVGESAFLNCTALQSVNFKNVKTVGQSAFLNCKALQSIDLGRVTNIEESAFSGCTALQSVDFKNVTTVGKYAFSKSESLESINLNNVTTVEDSAFSNCTALQSIDLGRVTNIEGFAFSGCTALQNIDLKNVETVRKYAFSNCTSLKTVTLPTNKEKATKIKKIILNQIRKNAGDGENGTIQFINDPDENAKQQK